MLLSYRHGRVRRAEGGLRRRNGRSITTMVETLESRRLLTAGSFGINVNIEPYSSLVNFLQVSGRYNDYNSESSSITLNASGDPQSDASLIFDYRLNEIWNGPDPNAVPANLSGTYHLSFNGQATILATFPEVDTPFTVENQVYNPTTNTTTADLVVPAGLSNAQDLFVISFLNTQATSTSAVDTGFSNAKLIRPGYAADSTQIFTDAFLEALQPYTVMRYLEPDNANGQPFFDHNTLQTVDASQVDQTGVPWEYLIALANQTHTDMWVNVPEGATNDYVTAMAGIFKNGGTVNGVTYAGLDPSLKIYLEYSNEVWGGIPFNEYYQVAAVKNGATNQPLSTFPSNLDIYTNADGSTTSNVNTAVGRRYLERTNDIGQIFQSVLGSDPTHQRIRPVLGWQENNTGYYQDALDWFQQFFGPASAAFYGMGDANYWSPTDYSSVDAVINSLAAQETADSIPDTLHLTALATYYGLKNVSYEGGPALSGDSSIDGNTNALAASRDPRMEQVVKQHYLDFYAEGGSLALYFDGPFESWTPGNEWGAAELEQYGNPTAAPKYQGTVDVAAAAPVAVTAGVIVAPVGTTSFSATTDILSNDFSAPSTGQRAYWLLNVASSAVYDLKMAMTTIGSSAPGQVEVFVDDKQVGSLINVTATGLDLGNLTLPAGLHTLSLLVVHGSNDPSQTSAYYAFQPTTFSLTPAVAPANRATGGTATASSDNAVRGEGAAQGFDGSAATKWLTFASTGWLQYQFVGNASYAVTSYAMTVGADTSQYPGRAPKDWSLLGSNDGVTWTTLDVQTNRVDSVSGDTQTYAVTSPGSYSYYRLNITANNGDPIIQLADLQLFGTPGAAPINRATGGTATSSSDNASRGEGAPQGFDGSSSTKWLTFASTGWLQYQFPGSDSYAVTSYAMTAGADTSAYPGRAPKDWALQGSNDGVTWSTVDMETNQADAVSGDTRTYAVASPVSYYYYRLNITANNGDPIIQLAELQLFAPPSTGQVNRATGGTATASSDNAAKGEGAAQAFDGSVATKWLTFADTGWLQYQFAGNAAYIVTRYSLTAGADTSQYTGRAPNNWSLLGSNDGVTWSTLDTQTNQADTVSGDIRTYTVASPSSYRFYRLNISASNGDPIIQLAELQLFA